MIKGTIQEEDVTIVKIRAEINEIQMKKTIARSMKLKAGSLRR